MTELEQIRSTIEKFEKNFGSESNEDLCGSLKDSLKDFTNMISRVTRNAKVHGLFVKNFDCEQIWQQLLNNDEA